MFPAKISHALKQSVQKSSPFACITKLEISQLRNQYVAECGRSGMGRDVCESSHLLVHTKRPSFDLLSFCFGFHFYCIRRQNMHIYCIRMFDLFRPLLPLTRFLSLRLQCSMAAVDDRMDMKSYYINGFIYTFFIIIAFHTMCHLWCSRLFASLCVLLWCVLIFRLQFNG